MKSPPRDRKVTAELIFFVEQQEWQLQLTIRSADAQKRRVPCVHQLLPCVTRINSFYFFNTPRQFHASVAGWIKELLGHSCPAIIIWREITSYLVQVPNEVEKGRGRWKSLANLKLTQISGPLESMWVARQFLLPCYCCCNHYRLLVVLLQAYQLIGDQPRDGECCPVESFCNRKRERNSGDAGGNWIL